ncbi:MAG: helix-turn-helix domain-containing protein [Planctomycetota bacterium]
MATSTETTKIAANNEPVLQKNYLTTTELAKFCGVSRFTIRNWIKQDKIRAVRTVGKQYRIPVSEAISFLETLHLEIFHKDESGVKPGSLRHCWECLEKTNCDKKCKDCLIDGKDTGYCFMVVRQFGNGVIRCKGDCLDCEYFGEIFGVYGKTTPAEKPCDIKDKEAVGEKKNFLYNFAYSVGRGVHVLKERSKAR